MARLIVCLGFLLFTIACAPRVNVITGTTIGLKATPGDGNTQSPQVVLGYKRAEVSLIPTKGEGGQENSDAASTLAAVHFSTRWFGHTELDSFIATGAAARAITHSESAFTTGLETAALQTVPEPLLARQTKLEADVAALPEESARAVLNVGAYPIRAGKTAKTSLAEHVKEARTEALIEHLESVLYRVR